MSEDSREAQFLAAQQARLLKNKELRIRRNHDETSTFSNNDVAKDDEHMQHDPQELRQKFWILFKNECADIQTSFDSLVCPDIPQPPNPCYKINESLQQLSTFYVTAQQRNEAMSKLRQIKSRIRNIQLSTSQIEQEHHHSQENKTDMIPSLDESVAGPLFSFIDEYHMVDLPLADIRLMQGELQSLRDYAEKLENIIQPREKFSFRKYREYYMGKIPAEPSTREVRDDVVTQHQDVPIYSPSQDHLILSDSKQCRITVDTNGDIHQGISLDHDVPNRDIQASSYSVRNIDHCHAKLLGSYKSLHIVDTQSSEILVTTPMSGPVHCTGCHDSLIFISSCRQLRIHDCSNVIFIIHVSSGPVIEFCTGIKFYQNDLIGEPPNLYWDVKDFNWLKKIKSPNFETFSKEFSSPKPFETIPIKIESSTLFVTQDTTRIIIDSAESSAQDYSSDDEL